MSQPRPSIGNILETVRGFLDANAAQMEGESRYNAQVSSYLLAICEREMRLGAGFDAAERRELAAVLGHDGSAAELNAELAARLRAGRLDEAFPLVLDTLLAIAADKVAVVRPDHLDARHRPSGPADSGG